MKFNYINLKNLIIISMILISNVYSLSNDDFYFDVKIIFLQLENKDSASFSQNNLEILNVEKLNDFSDINSIGSSGNKPKTLDTHNLLLHEISFTNRSMNIINRVESIFDVVPLESLMSVNNDLILNFDDTKNDQDDDAYEPKWLKNLKDQIDKSEIDKNLISTVLFNQNSDIYDEEELISILVLKFDNKNIKNTFEHTLRFKYIKVYNENNNNQGNIENLKDFQQNYYLKKNSILNRISKYPIYYMENDRTNKTLSNNTINNKTSFLEMKSELKIKRKDITKGKDEKKNKGLISLLENEILIYAKSSQNKLEIVKKINFNKLTDCRVKLEKNCIIIPLKHNGISNLSIDICEIKEEYNEFRTILMKNTMIKYCNNFMETQVDKLVSNINEKSENSNASINKDNHNSNNQSSLTNLQYNKNNNKSVEKLVEECQDSWASLTQFFNGFNSGLLGEKLSFQIYKQKLNLCRARKLDNLILINEFSKTLGPEYLSYLKNEHFEVVAYKKEDEKSLCKPQVHGVIDFCEDKKDFKTCFCSIFPLSKICDNDYCLLNEFDFECKKYNCMGSSDIHNNNSDACICKENPFSLNCKCKHEPLSIDCICLKHPNLDVCENNYCDSNPDELLCKCSKNPCLEECNQNYLFKNKHIADPYLNIEKRKLEVENIENEFKKLKEKNPENSKKDEVDDIKCAENDIFCICSKKKDYKQCICSSYPDSLICKNDIYCDSNKSKYECSANRNCSSEKSKIVSGIKVPVNKADDCYCKSHLDSLDCVCLLNPFSKPCFCRDNPKSKLCINELCSLNKDLRKSVFCCCDASSEKQCSPKFCKQYPDRVDCLVISKDTKSSLKFNCLINSDEKNCKKETIKYQYSSFINSLSRNSSEKIDKVLGLYDKMLKLNKVMKNIGDSI